MVPVLSCLQEMKKQDEQAMTQSTLELRQQAEYLSTGDDANRLMMGMESTAVDMTQMKNGKKPKKVKTAVSKLDM